MRKAETVHANSGRQSYTHTHTHSSGSVSTTPASSQHFHTHTNDNHTQALSALWMLETIKNLPNSGCCLSLLTTMLIISLRIRKK